MKPTEKDKEKEEHLFKRAKTRARTLTPKGASQWKVEKESGQRSDGYLRLIVSEVVIMIGFLFSFEALSVGPGRKLELFDTAQRSTFCRLGDF